MHTTCERIDRNLLAKGLYARFFLDLPAAVDKANPIDTEDMFICSSGQLVECRTRAKRYSGVDVAALNMTCPTCHRSLQAAAVTASQTRLADLKRSINEHPLRGKIDALLQLNRRKDASLAEERRKKENLEKEAQERMQVEQDGLSVTGKKRAAAISQAFGLRSGGGGRGGGRTGSLGVDDNLDDADAAPAVPAHTDALRQRLHAEAATAEAHSQGDLATWAAASLTAVASLEPVPANVPVMVMVGGVPTALPLSDDDFGRMSEEEYQAWGALGL